ncbi:MAG: hypothetical protein KDA17_04445 [Candidatus Saccharibacteria bacterium]|nr:hypothetical protein [Candidatus Saccharibacteria bacterium]
MERAKQLIQESNVEMMQLVPKASVGIAGSFAAMSINDWVGLLVGVLTAIFMILQIEAAWKKRKYAKERNVNDRKKEKNE